MVDTYSTQSLTSLMIKPTSAEEPKPETNKEHVRIYNHNLCPYAERGRLGLAAKKIQFQEGIIDFTLKAKWFTDINEGKVPIVETPAGDIIHESQVVIDFAEKYGGDNGLRLFSKDPVKEALQRMDIIAHDKVIPHYYYFYMAKTQEQIDEAVKNYKEKLVKGEEWLKGKLGENKYIGGEEPSAVDLNVFPILQKGVLFEHTVMKDVFDAIGYKDIAPTCIAYVYRMREHPLLKDHVMKLKNYQVFLERIKAGRGELKLTHEDLVE